METKAPKPVAVKVECLECGKRFTTSRLLPTCPKCGGADIAVA